MPFCCGCGCATGCTCAGGAPVGWKNIGPAGSFGPFGRGRFGSFGNSSNNNNNNNNNNSSNNLSSANNAVSSMLGNLLGLQNGGGGLGVIPPIGYGGLGCGFPFGQGFCGGMPAPCGTQGVCFDGCWGGGCSCGCDPCVCSGNGGPWGGWNGCGCCPTGCRDAWSCTGATSGCCNGVCWKKFKIVTPGGQEQCFPVAVPWWMCDATGTTGATFAETTNETAQAAGPQKAAAADSTHAEAAPAEAEGAMGCMSASQLLMQRYMIANPPRAFQPRNERGCYAAEEAEAVPCPQEGGEPAAVFNPAAMDAYQTPGVLIPSKEAE